MLQLAKLNDSFPYFVKTKVGAHRTISYDRLRNGEVERRVDTLTVDADDTEEVAVTITETTSRKGFSVQVKILIRAVSENACEATILAELRPIRLIKKQATVHKAFRLVTKEISMKYGTEGKGEFLLYSVGKLFSSSNTCNYTAVFSVIILVLLNERTLVCLFTIAKAQAPR